MCFSSHLDLNRLDETQYDYDRLQECLQCCFIVDKSLPHVKLECGFSLHFQCVLELIRHASDCPWCNRNLTAKDYETIQKVMQEHKPDIEGWLRTDSENICKKCRYFIKKGEQVILLCKCPYHLNCLMKHIRDREIYETRQGNAKGSRKRCLCGEKMSLIEQKNIYKLVNAMSGKRCGYCSEGLKKGDKYISLGMHNLVIHYRKKCSRILKDNLKHYHTK